LSILVLFVLVRATIAGRIRRSRDDASGRSAVRLVKIAAACMQRDQIYSHATFRDHAAPWFSSIWFRESASWLRGE